MLNIAREFVVVLAVFAVISLAQSAVVYFICSVWKREAWIRKKINPGTVSFKKNMEGTLHTLPYFITLPLLTVPAAHLGIGEVRIYTDVQQYGWGYFFFSIVAMIFVCDALNYWVHRLMHVKFFFKHIHYRHHKFRDPNPWSRWAFHPVDAMLNHLTFLVLAFVMPMHVAAYGIIIAVFTVANFINHLGYELFPNLATHRLFRYFTTATVHAQHHRAADKNHNYGFIFLWWDMLCGTLHPAYWQSIESAKSGTQLGPSA